MKQPCLAVDATSARIVDGELTGPTFAPLDPAAEAAMSYSLIVPFPAAAR